jgi:hypothetical protein
MRHDAVEVGDVAQGEDARRVDAGEPRPDRVGAGREQQPVARSRSVTVLAARSMAIASVRERTSTA